MATTTAQAFSTFFDDIEPTEHHYNTMVPARRETVRTRLSEKFPADNLTPFDSVKLIGSAAKRTAIRPVDDIDVLAIFSNANRGFDAYRNDSQKFLYRIRQAYSGVSIQTVGARGQAVRVFFETGGHVDIACVFEATTEGTFLLPAGNGTWISTRPFAANDWFARRHAELDYRLKTLVKALKKWNQAHSKRLNSFHLETIAASVFAKLGSDYRSALKDFFSWAPTSLDVNDPGGTGVNLAANLSWSRRQEIVASFAAAAEHARKAIKAEDDDDHVEAKRQWRIVLGSDFPA